MKRRRFFKYVADSFAKAVAEFAYEAGKPTKTFLRPPGSADEDTFLSLCKKCGKCIEACTTGVLEKVEDLNPIVLDTPRMNFENAHCERCYSCIKACDSGALSFENLNVYRYVAFLDKTRCVAYQDVFCQTCYWSCPEMNKAITLKDFAYPEFNPSACLGCGRCYNGCPTIPKSIVMKKVRRDGK